MYQIDVPTAVAGLPTPSAEGTAGFFTDGNPGTGTPATIVPADFLNMMMQELINVAREGTAPLSKSSYTQVRDAISNMVANASAGVGQVTNVTGVSPINSSGGATPAISISAATDSAPGSMSAADKTKLDGIAAGATANAGTVTAVTVTSANGVSASVANQGTTPQLTIALGAITPNSISCSGAASATSYSTSGAVNCGSLNVGNESASGVITINQPGASGFGLSIAGTTLAGAALKLIGNGATTPSKIIAVQSGNLNFNNDAGNNIFNVSDSGNAAVAGSFTCVTWNATGSDRRLKRNIRKVDARPLHRAIPYVSFERKADGSRGRGAIAQVVQKFEPAYVGSFKVGRATRLSLDYQSMAYEQAIWAGRELDRQAKLIEKQAKVIAKLEARLAKLERRI